MDKSAGLRFDAALRRALVAAFYASLFTFTVPTVTKAYTVQLSPPVKQASPNTFSGAGRTVPLVNEVLQVAAQNQGKTLWSMYPASVRGRSFGLAGPMSRGGGW